MESKSLLPFITLTVILSAGLAIRTHYLRPPYRTLFYLFKPLTTILILAIALLPDTFRTDAYARAIGVGLLFSLSGDVWIMLPGNRFVYGLVSFLIAHICYIFAFANGAPANSFPWPVFPLALIGVIILAYLWPALPAGMKAAVSLYVAIIVVMAGLAVNRAVAQFSTGTFSAAIGALLFMASDSILAIDRFRRPFHLAQAALLSTYYSAQLMIALSIGLLAFRNF
jgi:uncharacterized membrane protein YhhN